MEMYITRLVKGWLFDAYSLQEKMVFWIKQENDGDAIRLEDNNWNHSIYVAADDKSDLKLILREKNIAWLIKDYEFIPKYERIIDSTKSEVLKLTLSDSVKALTLARKIETLGGRKKFGKFRLYNVDLLPAQSYFYEYDIFPLAFCTVDSSSSSYSCYSSKLTNWNSKEDNIWSIDYRVPNFKTIYLTINLKKERKIPRYTDRINSIIINQEDETFEINKESEADMIGELTAEVAKIDPDFIFTDDGDSFTFPYLIYRAEENDIDLIE
jgi:DNA polymerase-2